MLWLQPRSITPERIRSICTAATRYAHRKGFPSGAEVQVGFDCIAEQQHWVARVHFDQRGEAFIHAWERAVTPGANEEVRPIELKRKEEKK